MGDEILPEDEAAAALKALAHPMRVQILGWLKDPESFPPQLEPATQVGVCLKHIQARAEVSQSTASQYMASLLAGGLVIATPVGKWTHYRRDDEQIARLGEYVRQTL